MEKIIAIKDFESKGKKIVFLEGAKQILLLEVGEKFFALDNRCPHEGFPLSEGTWNSKDCLLTCNWHNWKFDLKNGKCVLGGDDVRTYPVSVENDKIKIDLNDPSPEIIRNKIIEGFKVAFEKRQYGRLAREITRLEFNQLDPLYAVKKAILWSYDKFEYGMTHAFAATADWISFYQDLEKREDKIICLTEAVDHISYASLRHKKYDFIKTSENFCEDKLIQYTLEEKSKEAEGMALSGLKSGLRFKDFEEVLSKLAIEHYNDFGHSLIYVVKGCELSKVFDCADVDRALVLSLIRGLCYSTKEDLIPEFKSYKDTVDGISSSFGNEEGESFCLPKMNVSKACDWLIQNHKKYNEKFLYEILLASNSYNFLKYDTRLQEAPNRME